MTSKSITITLGLAMTAFGCDAFTQIGALPDASGSNPPDGGTAATTGAGDGSAPDLGSASSGSTCAPVQIQGDLPFWAGYEISGTWVGHVEGGITGLSSDAISVTIDQPANSSFQIHVVFGTAPPPPPATSATETYPPGETPDMFSATPLIEGFPYLAHDVRQAFAPSEIKFGILPYQGWESWCRLQTSYSLNVPGYGQIYRCNPSTSYLKQNAGQPDEMCFSVLDDGTEVPRSCAQIMLCSADDICTCDACGCDMSSYRGMDFDIAFDAASGTASGGSVQLMRVTN